MSEHDQIYESLISTTRLLLLDHGGNLAPMMQLTRAEDQIKAGKPMQDVVQANAEHVVAGLVSVLQSIQEQRRASARINGRADALELDIKFIRSASEFFADQKKSGWQIPSMGELEQAITQLDAPQKTAPVEKPAKRSNPRKKHEPQRRTWSTADAMEQWEMGRNDDSYFEQIEREARRSRLENEIPTLAAQIGGRVRGE